MQDFLPWITGPMGALVVLAVIAYLLATGKLHSDPEFQRVVQERDGYKAAVETERTINNELTKAGGITNQLIGALVEVAATRSAEDPPKRRPARAPRQDLTARDLGLK